MQPIDMTADELVSALLGLAETEQLSLLDSCGVDHLGSHLLIAGIDPVETIEINGSNAGDALSLFQNKLTQGYAAIFTLSYDLGREILGVGSIDQTLMGPSEPAIFVSLFDTLITYDYDSGRGAIVGNSDKFGNIAERLASSKGLRDLDEVSINTVEVTSNFTRAEYVIAVEQIQELIRSGDTYQTNLTQQLSAELPHGLNPRTVFARLRRDHPAPFAALIERRDSTVVSASPERFFMVRDSRHISTSPIKGTRPRGRTESEDDALRRDLLRSSKDRAENTMIVDLLRNDLGRICEYGTINVEKLCELEEHPTLFHLVSTISGVLRAGTGVSDILQALFPCGSITGAPKISTMNIIEGIEPTRRGLSMGAIGYYVPAFKFGMPETMDVNVAIRTMVIRVHDVKFNVGGGIVIDSEPETEYEESLTKAKALLAAIGGKLI